MDATAYLGPEHVVDHPVLGDTAEPVERRRGDDRVEMVAIAADAGAGPGDTGFDPSFQLFRRRVGHALKRSDPRADQGYTE